MRAAMRYMRHVVYCVHTAANSKWQSGPIELSETSIAVPVARSTTYATDCSIRSHFHTSHMLFIFYQSVFHCVRARWSTTGRAESAQSGRRSSCRKRRSRCQSRRRQHIPPIAASVRNSMPDKILFYYNEQHSSASARDGAPQGKPKVQACRIKGRYLYSCCRSAASMPSQ